MQNRPDRVEMVVRLPRDVKGWIERQSQKNCGSQNSEVVRAIRARMEIDRVMEKVTD